VCECFPVTIQRPIVIEAVKHSELDAAPQEFKDAVCTDGYRGCDYDHNGHIHTLEGVMKMDSLFPFLLTGNIGSVVAVWAVQL